MTKTQTIAGHILTLDEGVRYRAERPFYSRGRKGYPVTIRSLDPPPAGCLPSWDTTQPLTYEQANALVNEFNNGPTSFDGRIW